ncbi:MAG: hypothetical protein GY759_02905 [Chloroflexi bacterium]|nr:hypothetical protein [Chloroflexota bacterium]
MRNSKRVIVGLVLLMIVLFVAACGGDDEPEATATSQPEAAAVATNTPLPAPTDTAKPVPTDTPVPVPTDTPIPEPTATPEPVPTDTPIPEETARELVLISDLLDSYQSTGTFDITIGYPDGTSEQQASTFEIDWVRTDGPEGADIRMVTSGITEANPSAPDSIEIYGVGEFTYMNLGGEWITSPRSEGDLEDFGAFYQDPDEMIDDLDQLTLEGEESINGIETVHYSFDNTPFFAAFFGDEALGVESNLTSTTGDVWVAKEDGYVVKMLFTVEGEDIADQDDAGNEILTNIAFSWQFEITDTNNLDGIELPEGAPQPGAVDIPGFAPGEFPLPPDTKLEGGFAGIFTFNSGLSETEVNDFLDSEMTALGWSKEGDFLPMWTKDDVSLTIMVSPVDGGGATILVMSESGS